MEIRNCRYHEHVEGWADRNNKKECMQPRDKETMRMMKIRVVMTFAIAQVALAK